MCLQSKYFAIIAKTLAKDKLGLRKLITRKLKKKDAPTLARVLNSIFKKQSPRYFFVDQGTEFWNELVKKLMKKYNIHMYNTFSPIKSSPAERVIRTLMGKIGRIWTHRGNENWVDVLDSVTQSYNNTIHSATGLF